MYWHRNQIFILLSLLLILTTSSSTIADMSTDLEQFSANLGSFAIKMYNQLSAMEPKKNIVFSPFSIQACSAMARLGATGETAAELDKGLHLPSFKTDISELSKVFHTVLSKYENSTLLKIANRIYVMDKYETKPQFNELVTKDFFSSAEKINFALPDAASKINKWVESKTNNLIKDLISPAAIDGLTKMVLINAIHFKGEWEHAFDKDKTKNDTFYLNDVDTVEVPMMRSEENYRYASFPELDATALELPYKNSDLSMLILLPNEKTGLQNVENKLQNFTWSRVRSEMVLQKVNVKMPKFKIEFEVSLNDALKKLGVSRMFSGDAEFGNLLDTKEQLQVSQVIHKAFIEVNEEGTEAAAATAFVVNRFSAPAPLNMTNKFIANKPFIFIIQNARGLQLFTGKTLRI